MSSTHTSHRISRPARRFAPERGTILLVFRDRPLRALEVALAHSGATLLRADSDLHALSLSRLAKPNLIIVDVGSAEDAVKGRLLEQIRSHHKTGRIPVLAMVDTLKQDAARASCLRYANGTVLRDSSLELIMTEVHHLMNHEGSQYIRRIDPGMANSVDAVFSEIGSLRPIFLSRSGNEGSAEVTLPGSSDDGRRHALHGPEALPQDAHVSVGTNSKRVVIPNAVTAAISGKT